MPVKPKYKARPVFWNSRTHSVESSDLITGLRVKERFKLPAHIHRFDSQHEFKVYLELVRMYGLDKVVRQVPVSIFAPGYCYPRGKTWKVDFAIRSSSPNGRIIHYVEAKGAFLAEFALILGILEKHNFDVFRNLKIVFSEGLPVKHRVVKALFDTAFRMNLLTLKELEKLKDLL